MKTEPPPVPVRAGRIRVAPNQHSVALGVLIFLMWYAGASQNNGAAYLICFVIASVSLVSIVHAWVNLRGIQLRAGLINPAFAGDPVTIPVFASGTGQRGHWAIRVRTESGEPSIIGDLSSETASRTEVRLQEQARGCYPGVSVELRSDFPLGFFTARQTVGLQQTFYVYPKPEGRLPLPSSPNAGRELRDGVHTEGDDFAGVRSYREGESQRHIDWKAVARNQPMMVKQWSGESDETLQFDWQAVASLGREASLSQLTAWVLIAERRRLRYSLTLPGLEIAAGGGEAHQRQCLQSLASFQGSAQ